MAAVWTLARARLRARWRSLLGLALLVGVASGAVIAAAIGARRTDTAYARLLEATRADHVEVEVGGLRGPGLHGPRGGGSRRWPSSGSRASPCSPRPCPATHGSTRGAPGSSA